jgi:hypothetical protein
MTKFLVRASFNQYDESWYTKPRIKKQRNHWVMMYHQDRYYCKTFEDVVGFFLTGLWK